MDELLPDAFLPAATFVRRCLVEAVRTTVAIVAVLLVSRAIGWLVPMPVPSRAVTAATSVAPESFDDVRERIDALLRLDGAEVLALEGALYDMRLRRALSAMAWPRLSDS